MDMLAHRAAAHLAEPLRDWARGATALLPGIGLCLAVTGVALLLGRLEVILLGQAWLEPLVLAILAGTLVRSLWAPPAAWRPGIDFSAKTLLEIAVMLLGMSISAATIFAAGPGLLLAIACVVLFAIGLGLAIGRLLGLPKRMAILIACGNAICGNSAIAAVAPVIDADSDDVAASIAFTAVLGVAVVLGLPLVGHALHMSLLGYGALAGLTVYAVPQVLAAAAPFGASAVQIATLVKLVRVMMLGPVCLLLSLLAERLRDAPNHGPDSGATDDRPKPRRPHIHHLVPWFIIGFLALVAARSLGLVPPVLLAPAQQAATMLTILSMAALGLGVDVRSISSAGGRITASAVLSLLALGTLGFAALAMLGLAW